MKVEKDEREIQRLTDPRCPTAKEIKEHVERGHIPHRNWCFVCVKAKGRDLDHRVEVGKEKVVSTYCLDYCFPGDEFAFKLTVLAGRETVSGTYFGTTVPTKGSTGRFAGDKVVELLKSVGMQGVR